MINGEKTSICGSNNNIARRMIFPAHGPESVYFHSDSSHDPSVSINPAVDLKLRLVILVIKTLLLIIISQRS